MCKELIIKKSFYKFNKIFVKKFKKNRRMGKE